MPRQPRLDTPGTVHHVIGRRIEGMKIFRNEGDTKDFLSRVAQLPQAGFWMVDLWARRLLCQVAVGQMGYPAGRWLVSLG